MAGQTLTTIIAINAQANGFGQVGATLTELGTLVNGMSQKLINFGKESWEVYKDYEKSMHEAEVALSTSHGRNTKELADAMDTLNAKATEWAATTIFHTDDVANAINQAAHAGWDLDQILNGIPVAMQLAQAGSMDLSQALEYITKTTKAFGVPYEELGDFIDMWVYAANSSTGDVQDFGDAMKKLGATMRFTDSKEELFALIGLMHDMGESGSTAATLLRTSMMRIIAPSGVASKVMEQLGATDEEIREIREDASKLAALQTLEDYGFNAFKDNGQAKPMIQIYAELGEVLSQIAGGYDNITKNQTTLGILSTIFGTRGITGALDIVTALQNAVELRDKLLEGNAEGYGQYAAETMMDTAYGKEEIFESKIERLKQVVGEELAGQIEGVMEGVGGIVDRIAEMDEGKFSALISGLEVLAGAGPALLITGGLFRLLGVLLTPGGALGLGLVALTAAATAIKQLEDYDFSQNFGNMQMDAEGIQTYVHQIAEDFRSAYTYTDEFAKALETAKTNYRTASETFSSNLFSLMITNTKLTQDDLSNLLDLGGQMYEYVQQAIYSAASGSGEYWTALFGGGDAESIDNPMYDKIIELTNKEYLENQAQLQDIGKRMRQTIMDAFADDNQISEEEYNKILKVMREYNDMVARAAAEAAAEENYIKQNRWLEQAQTASLKDINDIAQQAAAEREQILAEQKKRFEDEYYRLEYRGADEETLRGVRARYEAEQQKTATAWDDFLYTLWDSQIANGGQRDNYETLAEYARQYQEGKLSADAINAMLTQKMGDSAYAGGNGYDSDRAQLGKMLGMMVLSMGGVDEIANKIDYYTQMGDEASAQRLRQLYTMEQLINNFGTPYETGGTWDWLDFLNLRAQFVNTNLPNNDPIPVEKQQNRAAFESVVGMGEMSAADARSTISLLGQSMESVYGLMAVIGQEAKKNAAKVANGEVPTIGYSISNAESGMDNVSKIMWQTIFESLSNTYDLNAVAKGKGWFGSEGALNYFAIWDLLYGEASRNPEAYRRQPPAQEEEFHYVPVTIGKVDTSEGAADKLTQLEQQGVEVSVSADATELQATIDGEDGKNLIEYLDGDAEQLHIKIFDEDGRQLTEIVDGNIDKLKTLIDSQNGRMITVNVSGKKLFSEGGRATSASIFGEAGPEWAIPEQHSDRTADLLNATRAASGFTWNELLARFGGMNANPQHESQQTTIVYSPTINANDANGVEQVLKEDKERFEKWYRDRQMRDAAEVYA